jgi:hypothetical protein
MKLFDVPRNTRIKVCKQIASGRKSHTSLIPPAAPEIKEGEILDFYHIDGMYSLCRNMKGEIVHLKAWTEVEIIQKNIK